MTTPLTPQCVPRLGAGFRLQWESVQDCHVLLFPEGMVQLNASAGDILKRCDGRALQELIADLHAVYRTEGLGPDVMAFVEMAGSQGWLTWD